MGNFNREIAQLFECYSSLHLSEL